MVKCYFEYRDIVTKEEYQNLLNECGNVFKFVVNNVIDDYLDVSATCYCNVGGLKYFALRKLQKKYADKCIFKKVKV